MSIFAAEAKRQWALREEAVIAAGGEEAYLQALRLQTSHDATRATQLRQQRVLAEQAANSDAALAHAADLSAGVERLALNRICVVGLEPRQPHESFVQYKARIKKTLHEKRQENLPN